MEMYWHSWLWVTFAVPIFYALDCVLDVFFVGKKIYRNAVHATVLSGLFSVFCLLALFPAYEKFQQPKFDILIIALANGVFYLLHIYFYFKALFKLNDVSNLECFLGFSILLVPGLAFLFLGETLNPAQYIGVGIALAGVTLLTRASVKRGTFSNSAITLCGAVIMISLTLVVQDEIYKHIDFYTGLILFMMGKIIAAIILWLGSDCKHILRDAYKFGPLFVFSQLLGICAVVFLQRAIHISPSITYVAAIETTTPIFIMLFSLVLLLILSIRAHRFGLAMAILKLQIEKIPVKLVAFCCVAVGIFITYSPEQVSAYLQHSLALLDVQIQQFSTTGQTPPRY